LPVSSQVPIVFCFFFVFIYVFATRSFSQVPSDPWLSTLFGSEVVFHVWAKPSNCGVHQWINDQALSL
jgi:hypothetical protein